MIGEKRGRPKCNKDEQVQSLYEQGLSVEEVAERMGYAITTVKQKLWSLGIYDPPISKNDPIWDEWNIAVKRLRKRDEENKKGTAERMG